MKLFPLFPHQDVSFHLRYFLAVDFTCLAYVVPVMSTGYVAHLKGSVQVGEHSRFHKPQLWAFSQADVQVISLPTKVNDTSFKNLELTSGAGMEQWLPNNLHRIHLKPANEKQYILR